MSIHRFLEILLKLASDNCPVSYVKYKPLQLGQVGLKRTKVQEET